VQTASRFPYVARRQRIGTRGVAIVELPAGQRNHHGAFCGWPYRYYRQHLDERATPQRRDLVARTIAPDYALGAHTASLGLASSVRTALPAGYQRGMFVGQHGSWNRRPRSGYKVIFVPSTDRKPSGEPLDVHQGRQGTGTVNPDSRAGQDAFGTSTADAQTGGPVTSPSRAFDCVTTTSTASAVRTTPWREGSSSGAAISRA